MRRAASAPRSRRSARSSFRAPSSYSSSSGSTRAAYDLVVTGEGTVDETTWEGKAPAVVQRACAVASVRCVLFGGRVLAGDAVALSGDPERAYADLVTLGMRLGRDLATS